MEDALVQGAFGSANSYTLSLNPCFNGRCTRTDVFQGIGAMWVCLNPCFNGRCTRTLKTKQKKGRKE